MKDNKNYLDIEVEELGFRLVHRTLRILDVSLAQALGLTSYESYHPVLRPTRNGRVLPDNVVRQATKTGERATVRYFRA
jgi:hypothetical protein